MRIGTGIDIGVSVIRRFSMDESGATALEYGFFVAFVAAALLVGAEYLAGGVEAMFNIVRNVVTAKVGAN
jgi:pilus assembly protein Flp/PilA